MWAFCRACKTDGMHTVGAADSDGRPIRVDCGYCHSEHNYRGGARIGLVPSGTFVGADPRVGPDQRRTNGRSSAVGLTDGSAPTFSRREAFPIVSERERTGPPMTPDRDLDLEL